MSKKKFKYIYGPVPSWRLGNSLGIDPVSTGRKICTFDCVYCQINQSTQFTDKRRIFIKSEDIIRELSELPDVHIDYITFSGAGEPTLASNIGQMIRDIRKIRLEKIAVITNASMLYREDVRKDLLNADLVMAKLDASTEDVFKAVNRPIQNISLEQVITGIKEFKRDFSGRLALQIMFVAQNRNQAKAIADLAREIRPDEVQLNTPLRPSGEKPLKKSELDSIEAYFKGLNCVSVYKAKKTHIDPISDADTLKRRGKVL